MYTSSEAADLQKQDAWTTIMLRRLPVDMTAEDLVSIVNATAPGTFDFVYVPHDRRKKTNIALAFINFVDNLSAKKVSDHVQTLNAHGAWTVVASAGNVQGLTFNLAYYLARFGNKAIRGPFAPRLFAGGVQMTEAAVGEVYKALPPAVVSEAKSFVMAERAGSSCKGSARRAQNLVWAPPAGPGRTLPFLDHVSGSHVGKVEKIEKIGMESSSAWGTHSPGSSETSSTCTPSMYLYQDQETFGSDLQEASHIDYERWQKSFPEVQTCGSWVFSL